MKNWFDHIAFHMRAQPATPAIVMEDRVVTYGMLETAIDRCARRIAALNMAGDAPVAVLVENQIRHVTLCLALFRAGIPSISLAHGQLGIAGIEFAAVLGDDGAKAAIHWSLAVVYDRSLGAETQSIAAIASGNDPKSNGTVVVNPEGCDTPSLRTSWGRLKSLYR